MEQNKKVTLVIRASDDYFQKGEISWWGSEIDKVKVTFPDYASLDLSRIENGVGIFARSADKHLSAKKLKILSLDRTADRLFVRFESQEDLPITSGDFVTTLRSVLEKAGLLPAEGLPFCIPVKSDQLSGIFDGQKTRTVLKELRELVQRNDWQGIRNMFSPIEAIPQRPDIWEEAAILDKIAYGCAKLAETSSLPRELRHDERRKSSFLKQQTQYRREVEMLRKRCTELAPENPGYWANLGFLHYQNVTELSLPGGRRDGDVQREAELAIEYCEKALFLDPLRVKEWYRRGYLLTEKVPHQILFGRSQNGQNRFETARQKRQDGIQSLLKAIESFKSLPEERQKRCRKEYIKSLYHLGKAYYDQICKVWDEGVFALNLRSNVTAEDKIGYIPQDSTHANLAWKYFCESWMADKNNSFHTQMEAPDPPSAETGEEEGVDKLYWLGKVAFVKYWIMSGYGQMDKPDASSWRDAGETYLSAALTFPWSDDKKRKPKDYVAELLARLYITKGEYSKAIECISRNCNKQLPYIAQTMGLALQLSGKPAEARRILQEAVRDRGNKEPWTTHFLIGCAFLEEGNFEMAKRSFDSADQEYRKHGKETFDTLLVALAFIRYKMNDPVQAVSYLKQSLELNPYRVSVRKHLENWQTKTK